MPPPVQTAGVRAASHETDATPLVTFTIVPCRMSRSGPWRAIIRTDAVAASPDDDHLGWLQHAIVAIPQRQPEHAVVATLIRDGCEDLLLPFFEFLEDQLFDEHPTSGPLRLHAGLDRLGEYGAGERERMEADPAWAVPAAEWRAHVARVVTAAHEQAERGIPPALMARWLADPDRDTRLFAARHADRADRATTLTRPSAPPAR